MEARRPLPGCIHHSDRGSQYAADLYRKALDQIGLRGSIGRRDNPYGNPKAESFMNTLKCEYVYLNKYQNFVEVVEPVPMSIDQVYNKRRLHSVARKLAVILHRMWVTGAAFRWSNSERAVATA